MGWPQMGGGKLFFPANPDLADILGDMDLDFPQTELAAWGSNGVGKAALTPLWCLSEINFDG